MSYTNPHGQPQGIALLGTNRLREILIAEICAINGYTTHIENSNMEDVNEVWEDIMKDEKEHFGLILSLLRKYDPGQCRAYLDNIEDKVPKSPMQSYKPNYDKQIILNNIREDLKGEYEAVVLYEQYLNMFPYPDIVKTLQYIINEEKDHAERLTRLLLKYDKDQYDGLK